MEKSLGETCLVFQKHDNVCCLVNFKRGKNTEPGEGTAVDSWYSGTGTNLFHRCKCNYKQIKLQHVIL